jgi:hypothetical protein
MTTPKLLDGWYTSKLGPETMAHRLREWKRNPEYEDLPPGTLVQLCTPFEIWDIRRAEIASLDTPHCLRCQRLEKKWRAQEPARDH